MEMNQTKQEAHAGDYAQQIQAKNVIVHNGCSPAEVTRISHEVFEISKKELTQDAYALAVKRVDAFTNQLIPRIEHLEGAMAAFQDPSFQKVYCKAQLSAACTDKKQDYDILAELIAKRMDLKEDDRYTKAGISHAIDVVDEIPEDALLAMTVNYVLMNYFILIFNNDFQVLDDIIGKFELDRLPLGSKCWEHLQMLRLVGLIVYWNIKPPFISIYRMAIENTELDKQVFDDFFEKIDQYHNVKRAIAWWDKVKNMIYLTEAGKAMAYANANRIIPYLPLLPFQI